MFYVKHVKMIYVKFFKSQKSLIPESLDLWFSVIKYEYILKIGLTCVQSSADVIFLGVIIEKSLTFEKHTHNLAWVKWLRRV